MPKTPLLLPQDMVDPAILVPYPNNPTLHADAVLRESITENGLVQPVTVNKGTKTGRPWEILGGHGTVRAFRATQPEGSLIQVTVLDVNDRQAAKILTVLNRSRDLARTDEEKQLAILCILDGDLAGSGWMDDDLATLRASLITPDDDLEPPPGPADGSKPIDDPGGGFSPDNMHRSGTRIMVLELPIELFKWAQGHLTAIAEDMGVLSNADVLVRIIAARVGERPPPTELLADAP